MASRVPDAKIVKALTQYVLSDGTPNYSAASKALGISRANLQHHAERLGLRAKQEPLLPPEQRQIIALADENKKLKAQMREMHRDALDSEAMRQILGGMVSEAVQPPKWLYEPKVSKGKTAEVPMTIWSDWHAGEVVDLQETNGINEFDIPIFERRVQRLVSTTIDLTRNHGPGLYPGMVVNLLGDMVSGGIHAELLKTDEEEVIPMTLRVRDILVDALGAMVEEYKQLYVPCTAGNHGRSVQKPEYKRTVFKSFDWLIYQMTARHFAKNKFITFDIPTSNEVHYRVFGRRYLAMHGDMMGVKGGDGIIGVLGPIMRGETKIGRQQSAIGRDYDTLLLGHWHQSLFLPRVIVNNTLKGFDEFAKNALRAAPSTPSQALWLEHPKWGRTMHRDVFLEDPTGYDANAPWVSVFGKGK